VRLKSVGRYLSFYIVADRSSRFLAAPFPQLQSELKEVCNEATNEIEALTKKKVWLERNIADNEVDIASVDLLRYPLQ